MDPNATLELIADAVLCGDAEATQGACQDLKAWILAGGFAPTLDTPSKCVAFAHMLDALAQVASAADMDGPEQDVCPACGGTVVGDTHAPNGFRTAEGPGNTCNMCNPK
jgi:hypothetical protein